MQGFTGPSTKVHIFETVVKGRGKIVVTYFKKVTTKRIARGHDFPNQLRKWDAI